MEEAPKHIPTLASDEKGHGHDEARDEILGSQNILNELVHSLSSEVDVRSRLDFMAAYSESAAIFWKEIGVLEGEANSWVARQSRAEPPSLREHRRSGVTMS